MLRAAASVLRSNLNAAQWQQCMRISTTKTAHLAAASIPEPQTNPDVLYTGVRNDFLLQNNFLKNISY